MRGSALNDLVLRTLNGARPADTLATVRSLMSEHVGAQDVRLLLADYQLTALHPIDNPDDAEALSATTAGHAFLEQIPLVCEFPGAGVEVNLPMGIRGDRIGVLQIRLDQVPDAEQLEELTQLSTVVTYAMRAAGRQSDALVRTSRTRRLTLAAELQWQLLPGRGCAAPEYTVAGHLEPAYHVCADSFDWSQDDDHLTLALIDGSDGRRVDVMLTTLAVTALRNARRAGLTIEDQARLTDQAIFAHHQGREHVGVLLLHININTGQVGALLAGAPRLLIRRDGQVLEPVLTEYPPLGMFGESTYTEQRFALVAGDRLLLISDGVHGAQSAQPHHFGDTALLELLDGSSDQSTCGVVRTVIEHLYQHRGHDDLDDDAVVLCADWRGPAQPAPDATPTGDEVDVELRLAAKRPRPPALRAVADR
ncbi:PP2C family protein-serine/threonine phosphatase [Leekyejoonella antrihumi]|uniref:Serine/threonine-protein phosphatase n=1 Tax=Leekyejoonella antrihumi TaxID=1660198 RepID=A0A563DU98_9MICO|nr:PP2C family protein-serine/threonine phosphatase [Leekyejoonella antrihumi]TWP33825.1 serine/threonine-protein phosphatase [Leekyejoonella antrihumi]